jgi:hypothetical protein
MGANIKIKIVPLLIVLCWTASLVAFPTPTRLAYPVIALAPTVDWPCTIEAATVTEGSSQNNRDVEKTVSGIILYGPPLALLVFIINRWTRRFARKTSITSGTSRIRFYGLMLLKMSWRIVFLCVLFIYAFASVYSAGSPFSQIQEKSKEGATVATALLMIFLPPTVLLTSWTQTKRRFLGLETAAQQGKS